MAGIGFSLERMAASDDLTNVSGAYVAGMLVVSGPWIFTALAIAGVSTIADASQAMIQDFRTILIYDFLLSSMISAPLALSVTRFLADELYAKRRGALQSAWVVAVGLFALIGSIVVAPVFGVLLKGPLATAATTTFFLLGALWLTIPFAGVLRRHVSITVAFLAGMSVTIALAHAPRTHDVATLLNAFSVGLAVAVGVLVMRTTAEFGASVRFEPRLLRAYARYWELPVIGLCTTLGGWVDKIIMWASGGNGVVTLSAGGFPTMPDYDSALFWAQLTAIPVMAVFFVNVEPSFYRLYRRFYGSFGRKASQREVRLRQKALDDFATRSALALLGAGILITATAVIFSYEAVAHFDLQPGLAGTLRAALFGVAFQTAALVCLCFLLYFDLRRHALAIALVGVVTNAGFTLVLLPFGPALHGYGYLASAVTTFLFAFATLTRETAWLTYHAFVTTNESARPSTHGARSAVRPDPI
ncbi:MAG: exopolysaccharide Pel transporter PelG [Alphaproteobacteria bacterium]|nr:exopolysaccharide Pel transporter PelG [Alphaproteobacteria bacterium]